MRELCDASVCDLCGRVAVRLRAGRPVCECVWMIRHQSDGGDFSRVTVSFFLPRSHVVVPKPNPIPAAARGRALPPAPAAAVLHVCSMLKTRVKVLLCCTLS